MDALKYIQHYPAPVKQQVEELIASERLRDYLKRKYPVNHHIASDKALRTYVLELKNRYLKKTSALNQVGFDNHLHVVENALGVHKRQSRVQGAKLKRHQSIWISSQFKKAPSAFLEMIVVHELAHLKELEHNKAFYSLCEYMLPEYHQREFDMRLYLIQQAIDKNSIS